MKINILLPTLGLTGGVRVIYEYANRLSRRGHEVILIYPYILPMGADKRTIALGYLKMLRRFFLGFFGRNKIDWFPLDSKIAIRRVKNLSACRLPDADVTIATANETADWLNVFPEGKGRRFYFIQDYETWTRDSVFVDATWRMPLKKIVIASWLAKLAQDKFGEKVVGVVPDGVDLSVFNHPEEKPKRAETRVLMMYHVLPKKGVADGLTAFKLAKEILPNLSLTMFGAYHPGPDIPSGIPYYYRPTQKFLNDLYSQADIFLWPSREEGFGLPPLEAMACRAAIISTDTGAIRDYADPGHSAMVVVPGDIEAMKEAIIYLASRFEKRAAMSAAAYQKAKDFDWEKSTDKLEKILSVD